MHSELAVPEAYVPMILLIFLAGAVLTWAADRVLSLTGLYRLLWHPSLFRASLLACTCSLLALTVYR